MAEMTRFQRLIGGLLGENMEGMTEEQRRRLAREGGTAAILGMLSGSGLLGGLEGLRTRRKEQATEAEAARRVSEAEAEMPRITGRLFGGPAGELESLPGPGGEGGPLTARYRQAPQEALARLYGTQAGRTVAQMAPDLVKLATEGTLGRTVGGSVYNPVTGQFTRPPEAQVETLTPQQVAALSPEMRGAIIQKFPGGRLEVVSQPPRVAVGRGAGGAAGGGAPGAPVDLSKSERDRIFQIRERMASLQEGVAGLTEARRLSDLAFEGPMAGFRATAGAALPGKIEPEGAQATIEFDLLLKQQVLPQLKSIFGAAPTEGERKILLELQGSSSLPRAVRNKILDRAIAAAQRRMALDQQEEAALLSGSYFRAPMPSPARPAAAPAAGATSGPPPGVTAQEWAAMTPEERELFK
jgi:hypothetical protein